MNSTTFRIVTRLLLAVAPFAHPINEAHGEVADQYTIATWKGSRKAAVSFTFDDGLTSHKTIAIPLFDEYDMKLTLFVPTGNFQGYSQITWADLAAASANGHEITSHTVSHPNFSEISDSTQEAELRNSRDSILANIPTAKCATMAYPYCARGNDSLVAHYYLGARSCPGRIEPPTPADFTDISSRPFGENSALNDLTNFVDEAITTGGWAPFLFHGVSGDWLAVLRGALAYCHDRDSLVWVAPFGNVLRYIMQRDSASLIETSRAADSIEISLTDGLDDGMFDLTLTILRKLPENWNGAIATQNGAPIECRVIDSTIVFEAVPDRGPIMLISSEETSLRQRSSASRSVDFTRNGIAVTLSVPLSAKSTFLSLYDMSGTPIARIAPTKWNSGEATFEIAHGSLPSGIYLTSIPSISASRTQRIRISR